MRFPLLDPDRFLTRTLPMARPFGPPWDEPAERDRLAELALTALHILQRDEHYVVQDGQAEIVDEYSGRIMADRSWSEGLQEMVERKEGLALSAQHVTHARMTYQRFFRRYLRLAGLSGTLAEVAPELYRTYQLPVVRVPLKRPDRKLRLPCRGLASGTNKWRTIARSVADLHARGAPVLIGTRTVAAAMRMAAELRALGLPHVVLNAIHHVEEALIVARAGTEGSITVATNMAGRGTDIRPSEAALAAGGLHVIISEPHEARRIDRQLAGRCGRQGEPGTIMSYVARDDMLLQRHAGPVALLAGRLPSRFALPLAVRLVQRRAEHLHRRMRRDLLRADDWVESITAVAGGGE